MSIPTCWWCCLGNEPLNRLIDNDEASKECQKHGVDQIQTDVTSHAVQTNEGFCLLVTLGLNVPPTDKVIWR